MISAVRNTAVFIFLSMYKTSMTKWLCIEAIKTLTASPQEGSFKGHNPATPSMA